MFCSILIDIYRDFIDNPNSLKHRKIILKISKFLNIDCRITEKAFENYKLITVDRDVTADVFETFNVKQENIIELDSNILLTDLFFPETRDALTDLLFSETSDAITHPAPYRKVNNSIFISQKLKFLARLNNDIIDLLKLNVQI